MDGMFSILRLFIWCLTVLIVAMIGLAHLPNSPLRTVLVQICGWAMAAVCGAYVISPVDVIPEIVLGPVGLIDDLVVAVIGVMSAYSALNAGSGKAISH